MTIMQAYTRKGIEKPRKSPARSAKKFGQRGGEQQEGTGGQEQGPDSVPSLTPQTNLCDFLATTMTSLTQFSTDCQQPAAESIPGLIDKLITASRTKACRVASAQGAGGSRAGCQARCTAGDIWDSD